MSKHARTERSEVHPGYEDRQRTMDEMLAVCRRLNVGPSCAVSAALYVAVVAAVNGLGGSEDQFLAMAKAIYLDVKKQFDDSSEVLN